MDFQVRIRTPEQFSEITYITKWLEECNTGFSFEHNKPNNHHFHIYLFGLNRKPDAMRKALSKFLKKECYSVSTTAGKNKQPISQCVAWQYGTEEDLKDPVWCKGLTQGHIDKFKLQAEAFYAQINQRKQVIHDMIVIHEEKQKPDRVWEGLITDLIENPDKYNDKQVHQIKSMISVGYLNRLKAIPRPSDLHRYAVSLFHIVKYDAHKKEIDLPLDALEEEYLR